MKPYFEQAGVVVFCTVAAIHRCNFLLAGIVLVVAAGATVDAATTEAAIAEITVSQEADGATVRIGDEIFTRYLVKSGPRPVLWPVNGPTGEPMTRAFPVSDPQPGEAVDHIHHRSIWVGFEGLNGVDFWHEPQAERQRPLGLGTTVHREFLNLESDGTTALIATRNDWLDPQGKRVCEDVRTIRFGADSDQRWIDYQVVFKASDGPLYIGDSKEGVFAVRVANSLKVEAELGGRIVSSEGLTNTDAWGKPAKWVDYNGPISGEKVGIAILCHPSSFRSPNRWHVRPYGLFAANPFGEVAFAPAAPPVKERPLTTTVPAGETLTLRHRVILHLGDEKQANIADQFERFAAE